MGTSNAKIKLNRWIVIILVGMTAGMSFELPYVRYNYQVAMEQTMGYTATQLGLMLSVYGMIALVLYACGGILADRFSCRTLFAGNMILTALGAFVMAAYPPFWVAMVVEVFWCFTTIMMGWSSSIKVISSLGTAEEQGRIMGIQEGMRGLGCMWTAFLTLFIFARVGAETNPASMRVVFIAYGIIFIIMGVICYLVMPDPQVQPTVRDAAAKEKGTLTLVLRRKETWLISGVIFGVYVVFSVLSYTASYLVDTFGMSVTAASTIGMVRNQVFRTCAAPLGGIIAAHTALKSPTKLSLFCGVLSVAGLVVFLVVPPSQGLLVPMVILVLFLACMNYIAKGMNWGVAGEVGIDPKIYGTTVGVCSVLGYLPDAFIYIVIGNWQDTLPAAQAYRNIWLTGLAGTIILLICGTLLLKAMRENKATLPQN